MDFIFDEAKTVKGEIYALLTDRQDRVGEYASLCDFKRTVSEMQSKLRSDNGPVSGGPPAAETSRYRNKKLPKLPLPRYNGDPFKWTSFWQSFESAVHCDPTLEKHEKFSYLEAQLDDAAASTIEGFALTNANYNQHRPRRRVRIHLAG